MIKHGIKETSEILALLGALSSNIGDVAADGKVSLVELLKFVNLWPVIAPAVENYKEAGKEILDIDANERETLRNVFAESLKLPKAVTEGILEEGLDLSLHLMQFIAKVRELKAAAV